jgi:acyl-CoA thioesterase FadM
VYRAADIVGWTAARMRDADFVTLQAGHHLVLGRHPIVGERLAIVSRIVEMRRVSGTWHHEARRADGSIVAADRSRGAFLDLAGNVRRPPADMIAALLRGEGA